VELFSQVATRPVYNTRAVVLRTGVPADTFRAWERRHGLPAPARTEGNHRLYSDRDVATISWLRDQTLTGVTIRQAIALLKSREAWSPASDATVSGPSPIRANPYHSTILGPRLARFCIGMVAALVAYDSRAASHLLDEAFAFAPFENVCLQVLQAGLYEIGDRWQRGEVLVSGEHFATSFVARKLGAFLSSSRPKLGRGPILTTCLEGELHEVGMLMTSVFLSRRGYSVVYLGPNLPTDDLITTIQNIRPPMVLLSASTRESARKLARSSNEIKSACSALGSRPFVPEIGFGGRVFVEDPSLLREVDGIFCGRDVDHAVASIESVLDLTPPAAATKTGSA